MTKKLRVVHYPQVPCEGFIVPVNSLEEAKMVSDTLSNYDLFQYENKIKPDYSNMTIVEEFSPVDGWISWCDEETGHENIDEYFYYMDGEE